MTENCKTKDKNNHNKHCSLIDKNCFLQTYHIWVNTVKPLYMGLNKQVTEWHLVGDRCLIVRVEGYRQAGREG